ncbi:hypothetical protein P389DRAFT_1297 [Cystobasidium minutum MCA 4210]|uniref:uncharacterized protein n=1 Tax=Cystobasidium minutum MCA 4210 TaxID=1397322 RepID=UPI0034CD40D8|eukprot:jgi/Rhomi1/1297/CE1296_132
MLGVDYGLLFELLGSFILTQTSWEAYDLRTHRRGEAICYIGCVGGIVMGLFLLIFDALTAKRRYADVEPGPPSNRPPNAPEIPNVNTVRAQAFVRTLIWPGLGAISGVVGVLIWHLKENERPRPLAQRRLATAAIVQAVGAAISVSAPSLVQLVILFGSGLPK